MWKDKDGVVRVFTTHGAMSPTLWVKIQAKLLEAEKNGDENAGVLYELYNAGYYREIPTVFLPYAREFMQESDHEYQEYLRLKEKFGD